MSKLIVLVLAVPACLDLDLPSGENSTPPTSLANFNHQYGGSELTVSAGLGVSSGAETPSLSVWLSPANDGCPEFKDGLSATLNGRSLGTVYGGRSFDFSDTHCESLSWVANDSDIDVTSLYQVVELSSNGHKWSVRVDRPFANDFVIDAEQPTHVIWQSSKKIDAGGVTYEDDGGASHTVTAQLDGNVLISPSPTIVSVGASDRPAAQCYGPTTCSFMRSAQRKF